MNGHGPVLSAEAASSSAGATPRFRHVALLIVAVTVAVLAIGGGLVWHARSNVNRTTLASAPRAVTFVIAKASSFRGSRTYVGTIEPWNEALIGPQYIAAYVLTVRVRPGDVVARGDVVATLDCASPRASTQAARMQAQAIDVKQRATAREAERFRTLADRGFAAENDAEQREAFSSAERSKLYEAHAQITSARLAVQDCTMRAPFAGEIAMRVVDPGAFVRPGDPIVSIVDRHVDRITGDVPERDFGLVAPGSEARVTALATGTSITAKISRRAPKADPGTRTVHFEIDTPDPEHALPVGTTGIVHIDVGQPLAATEVPAYAAAITGEKAVVFVADRGVARRLQVAVIGEIGGSVYLDHTQLPAGAAVITEGRDQLNDGDAIDAHPDAAPPARATQAVPARGAGTARPH